MARRKITDVADLADGLPELTEQQMTFVRHLLAGKSASDAYRAAYHVGAATSPNTIWSSASALRNNPKVAQWLAAARKAHLGSAALTREAHLQELERLREIALESGNIGAAVQAEQVRGKVAGHHIERVADVTDHDPVSVLRELATVQPDIAAALAAQHGIALDPTTKH